MNNNEIQQLYNELNNEILNSDINDICNICKLPTRKYERITLKCNHFYHIDCINISNRTQQYICPYCSKKHKMEKSRCIYMKKILNTDQKKNIDNLEEQLKNNKIQLNDLKKYLESASPIKLAFYKDEMTESKIKTRICNIREELMQLKDPYQCKRCTISDSTYCNIHIKKIKQDIEKSSSNILKYNSTKENLIETIKSFEILLNTNSEQSHICNHKKRNNLLCSNKTKNNLIYCGIHMKKLKKDINDNKNKLQDLEDNNLNLKKDIKKLEEFIN